MKETGFSSLLWGLNIWLRQAVSSLSRKEAVKAHSIFFSSLLSLVFPWLRTPIYSSSIKVTTATPYTTTLGTKFPTQRSLGHYMQTWTATSYFSLVKSLLPLPRLPHQLCWQRKDEITWQGDNSKYNFSSYSQSTRACENERVVTVI